MKLRLAILAAIISSSANAADSVSQPLGASTTLGSATNVWSLSSSNNNPAAAFMMVGKGDKTRFGILTSLSGGYELGAVDEIQDKIEELDEKLDSIEDNLGDALTLQEDFNELLAELGENATLKLMLGGNLPFMPFIYKTDNYGAFTFSADISTMGSGQVLSDNASLILNPLTSEFQLNTATSIYVKNFLDIKASLGYSNELYASDAGTLLGGARATLHRITLGKSVLALSALDGDEVDDAIQGEVEDNQNTTTAVSFDLGLIWTAAHYQLGVTVDNVNEPTFDYKSIGNECAAISNDADREVEKINCFAAANFASRGLINKEETHTLSQQTTVEASLFSENKSWNVSASYDVNSVNDALGDLYQWSSVSAQIHPDWWLISGLRGGYRKNMVGSELSYASVGATFLKGINFDVSYGLESVGDTDAPRSLYLSLGIETSF
ncbi:conjugal transfer protein TraF [uncultured Psychrosphaera sp.]|uniref:conjugal transfer protein TraF n=1 Tax=uncultured Psychrosphaera sp. TaxID=1403522 RepID=UPI0030F4F1A6